MPGLSVWLLCGALLLGTGGARADVAVSERLLGLSEQDVANALPGATKNTRPPLGPHGLRGLLSLPNVDVAGLNFETTFYFRNKLLERIEKRRRVPDGNCNAGYTALLANLDAQYGAGFRSDSGGSVNGNDGQTLSAAWIENGFKVMAYRLQSSSLCDLLVAIELHAQRDASDL